MPLQSEGPESKTKVPALVRRSNECAQPPACSCDSTTVTLRPYLASMHAQERPPIPEPMTTMGSSSRHNGCARAGRRLLRSQVPWRPRAAPNRSAVVMAPETCGTDQETRSSPCSECS